MPNPSPLSWRYPLKAGLLAGVVTLYAGLVGMIVVFSERAIVSDIITLGQLLVYAPALIAGYVVAIKTRKQNSTTSALRFGGIVGFFASLPLLALIFIGTQFNIRTMFVNVAPPLMELLTLGQGRGVGSVFLIAFLSAASIGGAAAALIPARLRSALLTGIFWVLGVGMLSELVIQTIRPLFGNDLVRQLFRQSALRPVPAAVIFIAISAIAFAWSRSRAVVQVRYRSLGSTQRGWLQRSGIALLGIFLILLPWIVGSYLSEVLALIGMYVLMGLGLNIAVGLAGLLDLGYVTNFAIGAYIMGVLTSTGPLGMGNLNFWMVLPISVIAAMCTGFLLALPVLRMRGDYLAIATLGFGEIIRLLALSDWLAPLIGGTQGILFIPKPQISLPGSEAAIVFGGPQQIYYIFLAACLLALFVSIRLNNSRTGRQWMAMREDEDAAGAMGIDTIRSKMLAFTLSAASGGLAGAIFAAKLGTIFPHSFNLLISVNALSVILVGGMGSVPGIIVGAFALIGLPELLREFQEYRLLLYGALLIVMMLVRPEGLWPSAARRRELHETEPIYEGQPDYHDQEAVVTAGD